MLKVTLAVPSSQKDLLRQIQNMYHGGKDLDSSLECRRQTGKVPEGLFLI